MYEYNATLIKVVDGDTLRLNVDLGCDIYTNLTVRLFGIDTPERGTQEGHEASEAVKDWFFTKAPEGRVKLYTVKDKREKYGRYLATVASPNNLELSLNAYLIQEGHARPYDGRS